MNTKHTAGPWNAKTNNFQGLVISEKTGATVAVAYDANDAQLIAAAPELLEALQRVAVCAETAAHLLRDDTEEAARFHKDAAFARAAIAKAVQS